MTRARLCVLPISFRQPQPSLSAYGAATLPTAATAAGAGGPACVGGHGPASQEQTTRQTARAGKPAHSWVSLDVGAAGASWVGIGILTSETPATRVVRR